VCVCVYIYIYTHTHTYTIYVNIYAFFIYTQFLTLCASVIVNQDDSADEENLMNHP
jgi:hypothetical protein